MHFIAFSEFNLKCPHLKILCVFPTEILVGSEFIERTCIHLYGPQFVDICLYVIILQCITNINDKISWIALLQVI